MTNDSPVQQKQISFFEIFIITCLGYTILTIFTIFFEEDLFRILTPFLAPFILLATFLGFMLLACISILYIPFQIRKLMWRVFTPAIINLTTFLIVYYFYDSIKELRIDIGFEVNKNRYNQAAQWVMQSINKNEILLDLGEEQTVFLPKDFHGLSEDNRVYVTNGGDVVTIFFSRGGGLFEYYPGLKYISVDMIPSDDGDIVCYRKIKPNWYECS